MSRPIARYTFERRARIRRTLQLRRRRQVKQASVVALSLTVLIVSGFSVFVLARTLGVNSEVTPLYAVTPTQPTMPEQTATPAQPVVRSQAPVAPEPAEPANVESQTASSDDDAAVRTFNGRPIKPVRTIRMLVTAYSPDARSCGKFADGITASGYSVWTNGGKLVAADTRMLPFGSLLEIPGYDSENIVPVLDVGGKIKGHRLDVLFPTHEQARQWGKQWLDVTVYDYAD